MVQDYYSQGDSNGLATFQYGGQRIALMDRPRGTRTPAVISPRARDSRPDAVRLDERYSAFLSG